MTYINSQNEDKLMQAGRFQRKIEPKNKLVSKTVVMDSRRFQVSGLAKQTSINANNRVEFSSNLRKKAGTVIMK